MNVITKKTYTLFFISFILYLLCPIVSAYILGYFFGLFGLILILIFLPLKIIMVLFFAGYITFAKKMIFYRNKILPFSNIILAILIIIDFIWYYSVFGLKMFDIKNDSLFLMSFSMTIAYLPFYIHFIVYKFILIFNNK